MKGWQIFVHSLRQVTGNFPAALQISGLLYLVQVVVGLLLGGMARQAVDPGAMMQGGMGFGFGAITALIVAVVSGLWIAVGWHRFILKGETANLFPQFRGDRMWAYFLRSFGYALIIILIGAVWGAIVGLVLGPVLAGSMLAMFVGVALIVYIPVGVIAFRLTAALPASALGAESQFLDGWNATKGKLTDLASLAVISVGISLAFSLIGTYVFGNITILAVIWQVAFGWLQMMVGVSVLTTLYGHYIEGRTLV